MKYLFLLIITFYQQFISPLFKQILGVQYFCRYEVTCSEYAKISIEKYGAFYGSIRAIKRILSCQPYTKNRISSFLNYGKSIKSI